MSVWMHIGGDLLSGTTKDVLTGHGEPSTYSSIELSKVVHDPNIWRVANIGFRHSEVSTRSSDSDRGRHRNTSTSSHYRSAGSNTTILTDDSINERDVWFPDPSHEPVQLEFLLEKRYCRLLVCLQVQY